MKKKKAILTFSDYIDQIKDPEIKAKMKEEKEKNLQTFKDIINKNKK